MLGALYDEVGFEWSTLFVVVWNALVFVSTVFCLAGSWYLARHRVKVGKEIYGGPNGPIYTTLKGNNNYGTMKDDTESLLSVVENNRIIGEQRYQTL